MHYKEAEKAARIRLVPVEGNELALLPLGNFSTQGCSYVQPWTFYGIHIMLVDGYIARIDIRNYYTKTDKGINISNSRSEKITFKPPEAPNHRMIFYPSTTTFSGFSVGRLPEIQYKNGCSKN
ncbi:MAG: hypothetical protein MET45_23215 [Nostoc sp. LLA-1]|nr:hypothetical protein [Cyanocohniella sp. LLY]